MRYVMLSIQLCVHVVCLRLMCPLRGWQSVQKEYLPGKPVLIATIPGTQPDLPSVLFNSHYDVVPCDMKLWHYDPFAAIINEEEEIVARGTQDMKCVWYVCVCVCMCERVCV
jgi:acetylornithine deacetylase/succinyl-diaminopimelate desuccinylase-like protein